MNENMSHTLHLLPWNIVMRCLEFFGKHICRLTYDFNILHRRKIDKYVALEFLKSNTVYYFQDIGRILNNVFQSSLIPN